METAKKSRGLDWILFFISVIGFFVVYHFAGGYCSMVLPFIILYFSRAMDLM